MLPVYVLFNVHVIVTGIKLLIIRQGSLTYSKTLVQHNINTKVVLFEYQNAGYLIDTICLS